MLGRIPLVERRVLSTSNFLSGREDMKKSPRAQSAGKNSNSLHAVRPNGSFFSPQDSPIQFFGKIPNFSKRGGKFLFTLDFQTFWESS
jgi:hypothetical protein